MVLNANLKFNKLNKCTNRLPSDDQNYFKPKQNPENNMPLGTPTRLRCTGPFSMDNTVTKQLAFL